jgi:cytidylate kinase
MAIVTVSRGTMSGGKALAERVAEALGSPCIAREVLVEGASRLGVSEEHLREKMERSPSLTERISAECRTYILATQSALADHLVGGDVVYHGLAGHLLLADVPEVLRVRLIAPVELRVHALMQQRSMGWDEAERLIVDIDQQRARWTRTMYCQDIHNADLYDVVLNLEKSSIESACAVVVTMARRPEFEITEAARARLVDFAIGCRVRLALALCPATCGHEIAVTVRAGVANLLGAALVSLGSAEAADRWASEVRRIAENVEGVRGVLVDLGATGVVAEPSRSQGNHA